MGLTIQIQDQAGVKVVNLSLSLNKPHLRVMGNTQVFKVIMNFASTCRGYGLTKFEQNV